MINDQEFLHGAAFLRLINLGQTVAITHASSIHPSLYVVSTTAKLSGILFKISTKTRSAWSFTFSDQENVAINTLRSQYQDINLFTALICHRDGVCCLAESQLMSIFNGDNLSWGGQRISVSRKSSGSYHVSGAKRVPLQRTVPQNAWPKLVV